MMGMGFVVITNQQNIGTPSESVEFCGMQNLQEGSVETSLGRGSNSSDRDAGDGGESSAPPIMIRCNGTSIAIFIVAVLWIIF